MVREEEKSGAAGIDPCILMMHRACILFDHNVYTLNMHGCAILETLGNVVSIDHGACLCEHRLR